MFNTGLLAPFFRTPLGKKLRAARARSPHGVPDSTTAQPIAVSEVPPVVPVDQGAEKIAAYLKYHEARRVVFGGHWSDNPGWLLLNEVDQDITERLKFPDNSVDFVFTEHVFEHVDCSGAIYFLRETYRILRPGGIIRIVCPMLDKLLRTKLRDENGNLYINNSLVPYYKKEDALLIELGLGGLTAEPELFLLNSMFREHAHKFIWNISLLLRVLTAVGFKDVREEQIGVGSAPENCIERRNRGIYLGYDWRIEMASPTVYDAESGIVEAKKAA